MKGVRGSFPILSANSPTDTRIVLKKNTRGENETKIFNLTIVYPYHFDLKSLKSL
jgi:hypothetical protein